MICYWDVNKMLFWDTITHSNVTRGRGHMAAKWPEGFRNEIRGKAGNHSSIRICLETCQHWNWTSRDAWRLQT